jgi:hypothetical protein
VNRCLASKCSQVTPAKVLFGVLSILCLSSFFAFASEFAQGSKPATKDADVQAYVGTWQARFDGKVFQTIKLENTQGKLTGTVSRGDLGVNDQGELISAEALEGSDPILEAKMGFGVLRLTTKREDEEDTIQFEMKLTSSDAAELRIVGIPEAEKIKPWQLERVKKMGK